MVRTREWHLETGPDLGIRQVILVGVSALMCDLKKLLNFIGLCNYSICHVELIKVLDITQV